MPNTTFSATHKGRETREWEWESGVLGFRSNILCLFLAQLSPAFLVVVVVERAMPGRRANPGACLEHQSRHDFDMDNWFLDYSLGHQSGTVAAGCIASTVARAWLAGMCGVLCVVCCPRRHLPSDSTGCLDQQGTSTMYFLGARSIPRWPKEDKEHCDFLGLNRGRRGRL